MTPPIECPSCGALDRAGLAFCETCDALLTPVETFDDGEDAAGRGSGLSLRVTPKLVRAPEVRLPPEPDPAASAWGVECWHCGTQNPRSRSFCQDCGVWLDTGSQAPKPGPPPVTVVMPEIPGPPVGQPEITHAPAIDAEPLEPYSVAARRAQSDRRRLVTTTTSVLALAVLSFVGLGYGASQLMGEGSEPETAILLTQPDGEPLQPPPETFEFQAVTGVSVPTGAPGPTGAPATAVEAEPEEAVSTDPEPVAEPEPVADPEPAVEAEPEEAVSTDPEPVAKPESVAEPEPLDGEAVDVEPVDEPRTVRRSGWVCEGDVRLEDPRDRDWSVSKVSFFDKGSFEQVVLHLERRGSGRGEPASVTAENFASSAVKDYVPRAARPNAGRTTVNLRLAGGVDGTLGLRHYRPNGLVTVREFSAYPAPGGASDILVSANGDGCFRLKVPVWNDDSGDPDKAQIQLDIRP